MKSNTTVFRWSLIILFCLSCSFAVLFLDQKIKALGFHQRDYPFYIQFAAKLLDPELTNRFSLNTDGFNYLGYVGTEGAASFHQSLHLEPVRYLFAAVYAVTGKPIGVFSVYTALYFLPIVYIALVFPVKRRLDTWFFLLFVLLYVFHPLSLAAIADDLRPRTLMIPALILAFLAIHWRRNWVEKLAFFGLLLFVREEAAILAAGLILYDYFLARADGQKNMSTLVFAGIWVVWIFIQRRYYIWTGYEISQDLTLFQLFENILDNWRLLILAAIILGIGAGLYRVKVRKLFSFPQTPAMGVYLFIVMLPLALQMIREELHWFQSAPFFPALSSLLNDLFFLSKNSILFAASLLLLLQIWNVIVDGRLRKVILWAMAVILAVSAFIGINAAFKDIHEYRAVIPNASILADLRAVTDRRSAAILTDYSTNQAFYDYENLYVYERLPNRILSGEERFYPANLPVLMELIRTEVEWVAIGAQSKDKLLALLKEAQIEPQTVAENDHFSVMRLR